MRCNLLYPYLIPTC